MSSEPDWRASITSSDRYDNIQAIKTALEQSASPLSSLQREAFSIENEAYKHSSSHDLYDIACKIQSGENVGQPTETGSDPQNCSRPESPGTRIGSYENCHYIASGVTAAVYRSDTVALKVIVETRNIDPHDPIREARILKLLRKPCIPLLETFRDQEQRFTLVFPFMPMSLQALIERGAIPKTRIRTIFKDLLFALSDIHEKGIIHRDIKPSAILIDSPDGPAYLSDFGTAWHPQLSVSTEPSYSKILDVGTGPYRAPETLFGDRSYGSAVDMWGVGAMLAECCRRHPRPLFESREAHEDGNQLGLILSIFKTIGSPTKDSWPEAVGFKTPPFDMYQVFSGSPWESLLPDVDSDFRELIASLVVYNGGSRATPSQALQSDCMQRSDGMQTCHD